MAGIKISSNFDLRRKSPLDSRLSLTNLLARDNLVFVYPGLQVYVESEDKFYYWDNTQWVEMNFSTETEKLLFQENLQVDTETIGDNFETNLICSLNIIGKISIIVNGLEYILDNNLLDVAYFSLDSGSTATSNFLGAVFYWNTDIAGYSLEPSDKITFKGFGI